MNLSVSRVQPTQEFAPEDQAVILNVSTQISQQLGTVMQLCGISSIRLQDDTSIGERRLRLAGFQYFLDVPKALVKWTEPCVRPLSEAMASFGISGITIDASQEELRSMSRVWDSFLVPSQPQDTPLQPSQPEPVAEAPHRPKIGDVISRQAVATRGLETVEAENSSAPPQEPASAGSIEL